MINYFQGSFGITIHPGGGGFAGFTLPFEFIAKQAAVSFFNPVNLFLIPGSPEIIIGENSLISLFFQPFHHQKIFPELANVIAEFQRIKIGDNGVAYAVIKRGRFYFSINRDSAYFFIISPNFSRVRAVTFLPMGYVSLPGYTT